MQKFTFIMLLTFAIASASRDPPSICMLSPYPIITAGQSILATVDNPQGRPCSATLVFEDPNFLPVTYDLKPLLCLGSQQAEVFVPIDAPNGDVSILWKCAGDGNQSCSKASIIGGKADSEKLKSQQTGKIECVKPTATLTTLSTLVRGTTTLTTSVVETLFSTNSVWTDTHIVDKTATMSQSMGPLPMPSLEPKSLSGETTDTTVIAQATTDTSIMAQPTTDTSIMEPTTDTSIMAQPTTDFTTTATTNALQLPTTSSCTCERKEHLGDSSPFSN